MELHFVGKEKKKVKKEEEKNQSIQRPVTTPHRGDLVYIALRFSN